VTTALGRPRASPRVGTWKTAGFGVICRRPRRFCAFPASG